MLKNVAPLAAFTPLGVVGAGLLGAAGELGRGKNIGQAARAGLSNAAIGAGATSVAGHFGVGPGTHLGLGLGGHAAPVASTVPPAPANPLLSPNGNLNPIQAGVRGVPATVTATPPSGGILGAGKGLLNFAEEHPTAAGMALQGVGNIATADSENRLRNAQAARLEREIGESEYDFQQRKAREAQYHDLWAPLGTAFGSGLSRGVAPNPYLPAGG